MGKRAAVPSRAVPSSARDCIYLLVKCSHVQLKEIIISMFLYRFPFGDRAALRNHKFGIKEEERQGGKCREHWNTGGHSSVESVEFCALSFLPPFLSFFFFPFKTPHRLRSKARKRAEIQWKCWGRQNRFSRHLWGIWLGARTSLNSGTSRWTLKAREGPGAALFAPRPRSALLQPRSPAAARPALRAPTGEPAAFPPRPRITSARVDFAWHGLHPAPPHKRGSPRVRARFWHRSRLSPSLPPTPPLAPRCSPGTGGRRRLPDAVSADAKGKRAEGAARWHGALSFRRSSASKQWSDWVWSGLFVSLTLGVRSVKGASERP